MSRQLDLKREVRETARRDAVIKALEFGIVGSLENQGCELLGFAIKYDEFSCLMTIKGVVDDKHQIAFVGSESIIGCILKADLDARNHRLRWRVDKYHTDES